MNEFLKLIAATAFFYVAITIAMCPCASLGSCHIWNIVIPILIGLFALFLSNIGVRF